MKRILSLILIVVMSCSLAVVAFATPLTTDSHPSNEIIVRNDGVRSVVTVADIDEAIHERNRAVLSRDAAEISRLEDKLCALGACISTQINISEPYTSSDIPHHTTSPSSVDFATIKYMVDIDGDRYEVERTTALPTIESNLYHHAQVGVKTISSAIAAGNYNLLEVVGYTVAGAIAESKYERAVTAFEIFGALIEGFDIHTTVYGLQAAYNCAALENVSFYKYKAPNGFWTPFASSSYVETAFSSTIYSVDSSSGSASSLDMNLAGLKDVIYSSYSKSGDGYSTSDILKRYLSTSIFDKESQVKSVNFRHTAGKEVKHIKTLGMLCPTTISNIT